MSRRQHAVPLSKEEAKAEQDCLQCMDVGMMEVAALIDAAPADLTREQAAEIVRGWMTSHRRVW